MDAPLSRRRLLGVAAAGAGAALVLPLRAWAKPVPRPRATIDLRSLGVAADGRTDDAPALARALAGARRSVVLTLPRPGTLLLGSTVAVPDGASVDFGGSTLLGAPGATGPLLRVPGTGVTVSRVVVDGNRRGGRHGACLEWSGVAGILADSTLRGSDLAGAVVTGTDAELRCVRVASNDHVSGASYGDGFYAVAGGRLLLEPGCSASGNDRAGVYLETTAAEGCSVNGTFDWNGVTGAYLKSPRGTIDALSASFNRLFGVMMKEGASGWTVGSLRLVGDTQGPVPTTTGIELYGCTGNTFRSVVVRGMQGYAVALAGTEQGGPGATGNRFDSIDADATGAPDTDPAIHISGGAYGNAFGTVRVRLHTVALSIGEGYLPLTNDDNTFSLIHAELCLWGAVVVRGGSRNRIDRLETVGCTTIDPAIAQGLVVWGPDGTADNTIGTLDAQQDAGGRIGPPLYAVVAEGGAHGNRVLAGRAGRTQRGALLDPSGANPASLA